MLSQAAPGDDYARMFPDLPPLFLAGEHLTALATELLQPISVPDNPELPAGYTYFGQLVAHDLSRMLGARNLSRPRLWLDSIYGDHCEDNRAWYRQSKGGDRIFVLGHGANQLGKPSMELDLPRKEDGSPEIPDRRDDFHIIIAQMHLAFMLLHNRLTMELRDRCPDQSSTWIFSAVRREICRTYQWVVVNDFLRRICDRAVLEAAWALAESATAQGQIPGMSSGKLALEFALAGFRFGHSMVRHSYALNDALPRRPIFHPRGSTEWNADWRGHRKLPVRWSVQWNLFFSYPNSIPQSARCVSTSSAASLCELPAFTVSDDPARAGIVSLLERTLRAGQEALLPSGQDVARQLLRCIPSNMELASIRIVDPNQQHPLWYYILKEAFEASGGRKLGPVGTWIVALNVFNILIANEESYVHDPTWTPSLQTSDNPLELRKLIRYSGLPITHQEWKAYVSGRLPEWA
jgi:hypothetical protein